MSESENVRSLLGMTAMGAVLAYGGWRNVKRINRVKDSAKQIISAASAGQVELEAIAWPVDKIDKCLENKNCILLELILEEYSGTGKHKSWKEVWRYTSNRPFLAFDHSGFVTIKPSRNQDIDVQREKIYNPHRMTTGQQSIFNSLNPSRSIFGGASLFGLSVFRNDFRIKEKKILLGSPILIHGFFSPEDRIKFVNLDSKLHDFRGRCTKLIQSESFRKRFFDRNKDGSVNREELSQGFEKVLQMSAGDISSNLQFTSSGDQHCRYYGVVSSKESEELQIADTFEEQYLKSKSAFMAWLSFSCGLFVFFLGLYLLARYFGQR